MFLPLSGQGYSTAARLKDYQQAETVAYTALLKDRLHPAIVSAQVTVHVVCG